MFKRLLAQLLIVCMLLNYASVSAFAQTELPEQTAAGETAAGEAASPSDAGSGEALPAASGETAEPETATASEAERVGGFTPLGFTPERVDDLTGLLRGTIPASYDSRDHYDLQEAQDQNPHGTCWAFSATAEAEGNTAVREGEDADYSEGALAYFAYNHPTDPLGLTSGDSSVTTGDYKNLGGNSAKAAFTYSSGIGPIDEDDAPYGDINGGYDEDEAYEQETVFTGLRWYNIEDRALIKQAIMEHGVIGAGYYHDGSYLNSTANGTYYYQTRYTDASTAGGNHAISIVGWDDNIAVSNFKTAPASKGAWLIRNSWGTGWGDDGYFWLSYCDQSLQDINSMDFVSEDEAWDHTYFYDGTIGTKGVQLNQKIACANVFQAAENEALEAVNIALASANVSYSLQIYKKSSAMSSATDGTAMLSTPVTGTTTASGIYTITLPQAVTLNKGEFFSVAFTLNAGTALFVDRTYTEYYWENGVRKSITYTNSCEKGQSFVGSTDLYNAGYTWRIKAYTREGYKITYVLNGGKNDSDNPSSYTGKTTVTLKNPTRTGYTFAGWYTKKNFSGSKVTKITKGSTGNKTFYAKWIANTYTISFNSNGGTSGSTKAVSATYGKNVTLTANGFKRTDYTFTGWNTKKDGSGKTYADKASVKNLTSKAKGTVTLYAQWKSNSASYTIKYVLNGGTNNKKNPASYKKAAAVTLYAPTRTGYTFAGWYTKKDFSGSKVTKIAKGSTGNKTFYAKWTANTYTIKFNANGGKGTMTSLTKRKYGTSYTLTANKFTKSGLSFIGWNTKKDGSGKTYADKASVKNLTSEAGGTVTLYAQWGYLITYVLNGGKNSEKNPIGYQKGSKVTLYAPTRTGYTFAGWYTKKDFSGSKVTAIAKNSTGKKTFYAKWTANTYTINFNANGGKGTMKSLTKRKYGTSYTLTANSFTKSGLSFIGWNTKKDGSGKAYADKASVKNLTVKAGGTVTLYAQWGYLITYVLNGGTNNEKNPVGYQKGPAVTLYSPTRTGYAFAGWYTKKDFSGSKVTAIAKNSTGKKTFYAKWIALYTIKFNANGGKGTMTSLTKRKYGTSYTLTANSFTRSGYTFNGWNTKANGKGTAYKNKASVKNLVSKAGGTITLYAQWKKAAAGISATVTFKSLEKAKYYRNTLKYSVSGTCTGVEIWRSTDNKDYSLIASTTDKNSYIDNTVKAGQIYYYKLRAYQLNGSTRTTGKSYSAIKNVTTAEKPVLGAKIVKIYTDCVELKIGHTGSKTFYIGGDNGNNQGKFYPYGTTGSYVSAHLADTNLTVQTKIAIPGDSYYHTVLYKYDNSFSSISYNSSSCTLAFYFQYDDCSYIVELKGNGSGVYSSGSGSVNETDSGYLKGGASESAEFSDFTLSIDGKESPNAEILSQE